ncbi:MAG: RdgB/HAM1 family non-canonical purine NTP pyrophosphatase [Chloroflexota bacterium]
MDLLIATQNRGKLREYRAIVANLDIDVLSLEDVGLGKLDVEETGETFEANAELKAAAYAQASGRLALADDSGLCVDALDGAPGVYSARYAGEGATDADRRAKLLGALKDVPDEQRTAYFMCVIVVFNPEKQTPYVSLGKFTGRIAHEESDGQYGFGYDPIFIPDGYDVTLADIEPDEKNRISHRALAAQQMRPVLERLAKGV